MPSNNTVIIFLFRFIRDKKIFPTWVKQGECQSQKPKFCIHISDGRISFATACVPIHSFGHNTNLCNISELVISIEISIMSYRKWWHLTFLHIQQNIESFTIVSKTMGSVSHRLYVQDTKGVVAAESWHAQSDANHVETRSFFIIIFNIRQYRKMFH